MIAAHMDEIGLMVKDVENGFVGLLYLGGFDPRTILLGQEVICTW